MPCRDDHDRLEEVEEQDTFPSTIPGIIPDKELIGDSHVVSHSSREAALESNPDVKNSG